MGDPRKQHKSYKTPSHPWQKIRIETDKALLKTYGLKNKKEIWKMDSRLEAYKDQLRGAIAEHEVQRKKERAEVIKKIQNLGLINPGGSVDDVLSLKVEDIMERRLQTILFRKGLARGVKQARQFITHGHITINGNVITAPGYLVSKSEEASIIFRASSVLSSEEHAERVPIVKKEKKRPEKKLERGRGGRRGKPRAPRKPVKRK